MRLGKKNYNVVDFWLVLGFVIGLLLLTYGGIYKQAATLLSISLPDLTAISAMVLLVILFNYIPFKFDHSARLTSLVLLGFFIVYGVSLLYSPSVNYGPKKFVIFVGCLFSFFIGCLTPRHVQQKMLWALPPFAFISAVGYLYLMAQNFTPEALRAFTGVSLSAGEMLGLALVLLFGRQSKSPVTFLLIVFGVTLLLVLGARGPLISAVLVGVATSLLCIFASGLPRGNATDPTVRGSSKDSSKVGFASWILLVFVFVIALCSQDFSSSTYNFQQAWDDGVSRFTLLFEENKGESINARLKMLEDSLTLINESPLFGYGAGSYGVVVYSEDFRAYPHNVPLEIWFEAGIVALLLFLVFAALCLARSLYYDVTLFAVLIYLIFNFLKSSSLDELRAFFLICGFAVSAGKR